MEQYINGMALVILPVFGCIIIGYLLRYWEIIEAKGADSLNRFVYFASFPALLFTFSARTPIEKIWNLPFLMAWMLSLGLTYLLTLMVSRFISDGEGDMAVRAMNCTCANTAFMGIPLSILALGKDAALPGLLATMVIVAIFFNLTIILIEIGRYGGRLTIGQMLGRIAIRLSKNPLLLAVCAGMFSSAFLPVPKAVTAFGELLGNAAVPCSLIAVGAFIAGRRYSETIVSALIPTAIKLLIHPLVTWGIVTWVVEMDRMWSATALLLAALPSAASCFVISKQYEVLVAETSGTVWLSTVLSCITVLVVLSSIILP